LAGRVVICLTTPVAGSCVDRRLGRGCNRERRISRRSHLNSRRACPCRGCWCCAWTGIFIRPRDDLAIYHGCNNVADRAFLFYDVILLDRNDFFVSGVKVLVAMATLHRAGFDVALGGSRTGRIESKLLELKRPTKMPGYLWTRLAKLVMSRSARAVIPLRPWVPWARHNSGESTCRHHLPLS
jgi:hypothetical protein